jgi:hypothetical protein
MNVSQALMRRRKRSSTGKKAEGRANIHNLVPLSVFCHMSAESSSLSEKLSIHIDPGGRFPTFLLFLPSLASPMISPLSQRSCTPILLTRA